MPTRLPQPAADDAAGALTPVTGILELAAQHGVLRTDGYLPGPGDLRVAAADVRRLGLRRGDAVEGAAPRLEQGRPAGALRPLVRIDRVAGRPPGEARRRPHFADLTAVFPRERLLLETGPEAITTRLIDLVAPIGKGTRGLIAAPSRSGKTTVLKALADAVVRNHPECHLMVVMIDERPEEVTDMRRSVRGEVVAATFDRPPAEQTATAELAVERAKRLAEQGGHVVVLLDSITRLCRAHNSAAHRGGRVLTGGVDATALQGPKRLFGAARSLEEGGSLTILATALVGTGSRADDYYFEELKGTGTMELRLDRSLAERRIFPAVDVAASGTRREELLLAAGERDAVHRLRRLLGSRDPADAAEFLLRQVQRTSGNAELLLRVLRAAPASAA